MYTAILNLMKQVVARDCEDRTLNYTCPECGFDVILKRGKIRTPHFAHKENILDCDFGAGETEEHLRVKDWLYQYFKSRGYVAIPECRKWEGVRPDIAVNIKGTWVAFEVQNSIITVEEIERRNKRYYDLGIPVMWILTEKMHEKMNDYEFKITAQNKYLHSFYYGVLYVFNGNGIDAIKIENVKHYRDEYYDQDGDYHDGYWYFCKTIYSRKKTVENIDLIKDCAPKYKDRFYKFPAGYIYALKYGIM